MIRPWKVLDRAYLLRRWWMNLRVDRVETSPGTVIPEFHVVEYPDWASTLALTPEGEVVLVEQYRHGIGEVSLELPAGGIDAGETPLEAARRELREETGYEAARWERLGRVAPEPSKHDNYAHLFVAFDARPVADAAPDPTETIRVVRLPVDEVLRRADAGAFVHGIHVAALFWALHRGWLSGGGPPR